MSHILHGFPPCELLSAPAGDVQCFGGDCYALAFGVPAALMVVALGEFYLGFFISSVYLQLFLKAGAIQTFAKQHEKLWGKPVAGIQ